MPRSIRIDKTRDVRWISVLSINGDVFYVDRSFPRFISNNKKLLDTYLPLIAHENAEYQEMRKEVDAFKKQNGREPNKTERQKIYLSAHKNHGEVAEKKWIESNNYSWPQWNAFCRGELARIEKKAQKRPPPSTDVNLFPHGTNLGTTLRADGGRINFAEGGDPENIAPEEAPGQDYSVGLPDHPAYKLPNEHPSGMDRLLGRGVERYQTWPERALRGAGTALNRGVDLATGFVGGVPDMISDLPHMVHRVATAPLDVKEGRLQVSDPETGMPTPEAMSRANEFAGAVMGTAFPFSEKGALGVAGGRLGRLGRGEIPHDITERTATEGLSGRGEPRGYPANRDTDIATVGERQGHYTSTGPTDGRPDVVFMVHDPEYGKPYKAGDGLRVNEYDDGLRLQQEALGSKPPEGLNSLTVNDILHPDYPSLPNRSRNVSDIGQELHDRGSNALKQLGVKEGKITGPNPKTDDLLSHAMASEIESAMSRGGKNASDWYTSKITKAMDLASKLHPEITTDPHHAMGFRAALAITSQGERVPSNVRLANIAYEYFKKTGQFPTNIEAKKAPSINENFRKLNDLIKELGPEGTRDFLHKEFTVRDLEKSGYKIGGENKDQKVYGSAIFGSKIGQGFYQNLSGNYNPVTMDLWFMRAFGRLAGTLKGKDPKVSAAQRERLISAMKEEGIPPPNSDDALKSKAKDLVSKHEKHYFANRPGYASGQFKKSELTNAAERYLFGFEGLNEAPSSGGQRAWMRNVVNLARQKLANRGINVTNADLQAIWWYPEKELYDKLGGRDSEGINVDYASAISDLLTKRGIKHDRPTEEARSIRPVDIGRGRASKASNSKGVKGGSKEGQGTTGSLPGNLGDLTRASGGRVLSHYIDRSPSEAQKAAGNYRKGHVRVHGLDITIENAKGSERSGVGDDGKPWSVKMPHHYGYILGTVGKDKDHIDVYLGPHHSSKKVFIVDQKNSETGRFDEHKCWIGFGSETQVKQSFIKAFSDGKGKKRLGHVTEMNIDEFRSWLRSGNTEKPLNRASGGRIGYDDGGTVGKIPSPDFTVPPVGLRPSPSDEYVPNLGAAKSLAAGAVEPFGQLGRVMTGQSQNYPADILGAAAGLAPIGPPGAGRVLKAGAEAVEGAAAKVSTGGLEDFIKAYHGSPHDFDKFDLNKIGTGEGAQSYGHGLYFAENEGVAKSYRNALSNASIDGHSPDEFLNKTPQVDTVYDALRHVKKTNPSANIEDASLFLHTSKIPSERRVADAISTYKTPDSARLMLGDKDRSTLDQMIKDGRIKDSPGKMYQVAIKENPDHFLDWDKPLSKQHEKVQKAITNLRIPDPLGDGNLGETNHMMASGEEVHKAMVQRHGSNAPGSANWKGEKAPDAIAAKDLREAGIPGIRYLDQGSRNSGKVTVKTEYRHGELDDSPRIHERFFASRYKENDGNLKKTISQLESDNARIPGDNTIQKTLDFARDNGNKFKLDRTPQTRNYVVFNDNLIDILKKYGIAGIGVLPAMNAYHYQDDANPK